MKKKERCRLILLFSTLAVVVAAIILTLGSAATVKTEYYDTQVAAARKLEACFAAVRDYKKELGIPMSEDDLHRTGMIGLPYTGITTTQGALESKRTAAWPDMAALCVRMLYEAGVRPGDTVGAGFSGSFPGMNLAVIAACESMGVELVCISSVGASTYGANNPELTFPEMMVRLEEDGFIQTKSAAVTMGGYHDTGADMDRELAGGIEQRLIEAGLTVMKLPDFEENLEFREALYREKGPITCFIAVGGNLTSLGQGEAGVSLGQGVLLPGGNVYLEEGSGLVQRYLAKGIPVINLLNLKKIMADYSMPYDPVEWPAIGESGVYTCVLYEKGALAAGFVLSAALLAACRWLRQPGRSGKGKGPFRK